MSALTAPFPSRPALLAVSIPRTYPGQTPRIIRAQALTLRAFVLHGLGTGVGSLISFSA